MSNKTINDTIKYSRHFYKLPAFTSANTDGNTISTVPSSSVVYDEHPLWHPLSGITGRYCQLYCNQSTGYGEILITSIKPMKIKGIKLTNRITGSLSPYAFYIKNGSITVLNASSRTQAGGAVTTNMFSAPAISSSLQLGFIYGTSSGYYYVDIPSIEFIY